MTKNLRFNKIFKQKLLELLVLLLILILSDFFTLYEWITHCKWCIYMHNIYAYIITKCWLIFPSYLRKSRMEVEERCSKLLEEVRAKIGLLSAAVEEISLIKKNLKITGSDVKAQIRDSISRHLEALRNRETWLLNQVEVVQHIKEDVLRQQQAVLNQALGSLKSTCALLEECYESGSLLNVENLEGQLEENLAHIDQLNLQAEETSSISFYGNNFLVQEAIKQFGVVDSDGLHDQHIMSSFQGLKISPSGPENVKLHYPSAGMEAWLLKKEGSIEPRNFSASMTWPHSNLSIKDWLLHSSHPPVAEPSAVVINVPEKPLSVKSWLINCQPEKPAGDAGCRSEAPEQSKWLMMASSPSTLTDQPKVSGLGQYYHNIKCSDPSKWLKARQDISAALSTDLIGKIYASIMASGRDQWLIKKRGGNRGQGVCSDKVGSSCADCVYCQIPNGEVSTMTKKSVTVSEASSELSDWLAVQQQVVGSEEDAWVVPVKDIEEAPLWLLMKNSSSAIQSKASTDDDRSGMGKFLQDLTNTDAKEWFSSASSQSMSSLETADSLSTPLSADGWLLCSTDSKSSQENGMSLESFYHDVLSSDTSQWLQQPSGELETAQEKCEDRSGLKQYIENLAGDYNQWLSPNSSASSDICKWLARSSSDRCKNCPKMCSKDLFKVFDELSNSTDGWLMTSAD